jgi:hypothetical protein
MSDEIKLRVAKALTRWMDSECKPELADWDNLPKEIQDAYLDQADAAINELRVADVEIARDAEPQWVRVNSSLHYLEHDGRRIYRTTYYGGGVAMAITPC